MEDKQIKTLKSFLEDPKKIVIVPHKSPDGDAMGSTLALQHLLASEGHQSTVISPNNFADFLSWIPGAEGILVYNTQTEQANTLIAEADLIFTLDFNMLSRSGDMKTSLERAKARFVMIDHHRQPGTYADFIYSDVNSSSTCELIYNFIQKLNKTNKITPAIATCLYVGIMTDTGSFRFPSTSSATHRVIADLMDKGAENAAIYQKIYDTKTPEQLKLLGVALDNLTVFGDMRAVYTSLSQEELDRHHFKKGDTEGFVNYGLSLKGIVFSVIFIENKQEGIIKISLRSKGDFDVNTIARKHYDGGGHLNAAGGKSDKSLSETTAEFESLLTSYQDQLTIS